MKRYVFLAISLLMLLKSSSRQWGLIQGIFSSRLAAANGAFVA